LIEKPIGRNLNESIEILNILDGCTVIGGYNYRFLPGVAKLFELIKNKSLGELKTVNMSLGHGGSPSDTSSWKLNPAKSGGGVILDPGIHLLDLVLNILQISKENINLKTLNVLTNKGFWNTGIEENALISFKTFNEAIFKINVSITEWKNKFEILAIGNDAQMIINGRGGNYGVHNYQIIPRWHWSEDKVNNEHVEFPDSDSMRYEIQAIVLFILNNFDSSKLVINKKNLELMKLYDTIKLNEK
jgi:predicted dehydrogenase